MTDYYVPPFVKGSKPWLGQSFGSLDDGIEFYKRYARFGGFDIRLSTVVKAGDVINWRYVFVVGRGMLGVMVVVGNWIGSKLGRSVAVLDVVVWQGLCLNTVVGKVML